MLKSRAYRGNGGEKRQNDISSELDYIEGNRNIVAVYYNDKKELLDKLTSTRVLTLVEGTKGLVVNCEASE